MQVDILTIKESDVKKSVIKLTNMLNGTALKPNDSRLTFDRPVVDEGVILRDMFTTRTLLLNKININEILPSVIDLRPIKSLTKEEFQLPPELDEDFIDEYIAAFNNKHNGNHLSKHMETSKYQTNYSDEEIYNFTLFCKTVGFFELDITECDLSINDNVMIINVNSTHPIYTGSIEVLI